MENEDINEAGKEFNVEKPGDDHDMLEDMTIIEEPTIVDFERLAELTDCTEMGSSQLADLVKNWEYKQANAVRLLREELDSLSSRQQNEVELKKLEILEEQRFVDERYEGDKHPITILDGVVIDAEDDTVKYWKQRATNLEILLEASIQREQLLQGKLQESIENLERQSSPVEELSQVLKRADNFLHLVLQNAPVVNCLFHLRQDKDLRYRFIYNHFPRFREEEIIGKTDMEIFSESQDFKREVLEKGLPAKREITFETELFGLKTFLFYVEPVFSRAGETIGINYMGMEVTDQVAKREKIARHREEIAVQKAKETELNKTIHITGVMMLEATKFRPREVVKQVLQTAAASVQKMLILEGNIEEDIPIEVIGDVLLIRKILTNLISNAVKFTHKGKVGIKLYVIPDPCQSTVSASKQKEDKKLLYKQSSGDQKSWNEQNASSGEQEMRVKEEVVADGCKGNELKSCEMKVWIRCDVYDTGIGIPESALPNIFKKYMEAGADTAQKYGGTGLGLAICKQLVELMGGHLTVSSKEHHGSTFTFELPYKVSPVCDGSDDPDELSDMTGYDDATSGFFRFQPDKKQGWM